MWVNYTPVHSAQAKEIWVPAAIGYDTKRNRLLIPQIALSSVTMVELQ